MSKDTLNDERRHHFFIIDNEVIDAYLPVIGVTPYAVYSVLCRMAREGSCFPGVKVVAERAGCAEATARNAINTLSGKDGRLTINDLAPLIDVTPRYDKEGRQQSSLYTICDVAKDSGEGGTEILYRGGVRNSIPKQDVVKNKTVETTVSTKAPNLTHDTHKAIVMAFYQATGIEPPKNWAVPLRHAKTIHGLGCMPEDIPGYVAYLKSLSWVTGGVTMGLAASADRWDAYRMSKQAPGKKRLPVL